MSQMLDNVARAIWAKRREIAALRNIELEEWGDGTVPINNFVHMEALAAVSAMRHPTDEMISAATDFASPGGDIACDEIGDVFKAMIDAALK